MMEISPCCYLARVEEGGRAGGVYCIMYITCMLIPHYSFACISVVTLFCSVQFCGSGEW